MSAILGTSSKPQAQQQPAVAGLQIQTSAYGKVIPIVYGTTRIAPNLIWYGDFQAIAHNSNPGGGGGKGGGGGGGGGKGGGGGSVTYTYQAAVALVLAHEGGFQNAADDPGNWTGGRVGAAGTLKGTKYGISAASYPDLDIANLSTADAIAIYRRDWWDRFGIARLPPPLAAKLFDAGVNIGMAEAVRCLQRALRACGESAVAEDGELGPATIAAATAAPPLAALAALREAIAGHYRLVAARNAGEQRYLAGWLARAYA